MLKNFSMLDIEKNCHSGTIAAMDAAEIKQLIGSNLRRLREGRDLKGKELAEIMGVTPAQISRIEHGRGIGDDTLAALCNALHVDPLEFFRPIRGIGRVAESAAEYNGIQLTADPYTIEDDAMAPKYETGDVVYASRSKRPDDGDYALARLDDGRSMVRKVHFHDGKVLLRALSPSCKPLLMDEPSVRLYKIVGSKEK